MFIFCHIFPYISVPHVFEAVRVPAVEGETGAREAAQKAEADQSVHGIFYLCALSAPYHPLI